MKASSHLPLMYIFPQQSPLHSYVFIMRFTLLVFTATALAADV